MQLLQQQQPSLFMNQALQQAFLVLQLPLLECAQWVETQVEENPLLELLPREKASFAVHDGCYSIPTLSEDLLTQARCTFADAEDLALAECIIGHLNERGFLDLSLEELPSDAIPKKWGEILEEVQGFDPPGIAARNVREALLLQLKHSGRNHSFAYRILCDHYEDLLHYRLSALARALKLPIMMIEKIVQEEIAILEPFPARSYLHHNPQRIAPDILFQESRGGWGIEMNDEPFPQWQLHPIYKELDRGELAACRSYLQKATWLQKILYKRAHLLSRIGSFLLEEQKEFFNNGVLKPLSVQSSALQLCIHPATLARAIAYKYASIEGHFVALSHFFQRRSGESGTLSTLQQQLLHIIEKEDKQAPLSDAALSFALEQRGFSCARRTIAKYRAQLFIQSAQKRRRA